MTSGDSPICPILDSHGTYFFEDDTQLLKEKALKVILKYGRAEAQSWP